MTPAERKQHHQSCQAVQAEGYIAREEGQPRQVCPYFTGPEFELRQHWIAGWDQADQEMKTRRAQA